MVLGTLMIPAVALLYHGVKESWKYYYRTPALPKGIKGNAQWTELRYRHPSPGNDPTNGPNASREMERHHFKTPYYASRYHVRNYWDDEFERGSYKVQIYLPNPDSLDKETISKMFTSNDKEKELREYKEYYNKVTEIFPPIENPYQTPKQMIEGAIELKKETEKLNEWEDMGDFPDASPYVCGPDTFLHPGLPEWSSHDMQIYMELETLIEESAEKVRMEGINSFDGDANDWKVLDSMHRRDQQQEVVKVLKQRSPGRIE